MIGVDDVAIPPLYDDAGGWPLLQLPVGAGVPQVRRHLSGDGEQLMESGVVGVPALAAENDGGVAQLASAQAQASAPDAVPVLVLVSVEAQGKTTGICSRI